MKKITFLLLLTFVVALIAGCQSNEAQPTATAMPVVEPTATYVPAQEPTAEAVAPSPAVETADLGTLTANPWQWVAFTDPLQQFEVETPENYLLTFNQDGTVAIKADCNNAMGSYTADAGGSLKIEVGPMTKAACPPESRSDEFVANLGFAARYFFEDGFLYIDLFADGGTMAFAVAGEPESAGDITSYPWLWTSFTSPVEQFEVEAPETYVVTFNEDTSAALGASGTVNIKADCDNASGSYTVDGGSVTIEIGPMTKAACPPESRSDPFVALLGGAARYFFEDAQLYIDLFADGGTMVFAPEGEAEMAEAAAQSAADSGLPPADIANDEGGPAVVSGEWAYTAAAVATHYLEPVAVLMDVSRQVQGDYTEWTPRSGQMMGTLTRPLAPAPAAYEVDVAIQPGGASVDLDNDGQEDAGVQIYAAILGTNLVGDSYLEQVEQDGFKSYLFDPQTGAIREGTFLVYAPDDAQGFPSSAGEDGLFFTADDPAVALPAGYTLVTLSNDGQVSFDRSREADMPILEAAAYATPDFSDQGILESFNSLIDLLSVRYSYTDLRGLDWEEIRQEYLPRVEAADAAGDFAAYYAAMNDLALSIRDAHVYLYTSDVQLKQAAIAEFAQESSGNLGAQVVEMSDGRFVVIALDPEGPGAEAGWVFGTEIVSVDGVPIGERVDTLPIIESAGNPEVIRLAQTNAALAFPAGTETTIEYLQPGESEVSSVTLAAVEGASAPGPQLPVDDASISFKQLDGGVYYIQWKMFNDPLYKMAVWEKLLSEAQGSPGIIIDMRHNGGGATDLLYTMASYFFTPEEPAQSHWIDNYAYDDKAGDLVQEFAADYPLSSPRPELTYNGAVAVLVGEGSASAAEYLPQFLQRQGRAIVVGEHGTEGAGGYLERAIMPGGFTFFFTKGRTYFAGTDELNLEAKGVSLDVRVPITEENEKAKQEGRDVVLEAGLVALGEEAARLAAENLPGTTWQMFEAFDAGTAAKIVFENPEAYTITFGEDGAMSIQADCNQVNAEYTIGAGGAMTITPGPATLAACPEGSLGEQFVQLLGKTASFQTDNKVLALFDTDGGVMLFNIAEGAVSAADTSADTSTGELPADLVAQLDAWLNSQVYSEGGYPAGAAPGLVLLVDTPEGRYLKAAGVSSIEEGTPMQVDDRLEIGSNTKSFTIVLLMQLQEEGVLSFDDLLSDWLPEQAAQFPNGDQITLRQMAQHTAGLWDYGDDIIGGGAVDPDQLEKGYTPDELVQYAIENGTPYFAPGEEGQWKYSNTGYILLGMIAEKATGQSLGDLYQERIFEPLGLETAVLIEGVPQESEITSQGYWWTDDGDMLNTTNWNASQGWAAGAVAMSAEDLAAYGKALAAGELFQSADTLAQMLAFDDRALYSVGGPYGLGLIDFGNGYWGHEGQTAGFQTLWYTDPEEQITVVGLTNSASYKAFAFLNVVNILEGEGAKPFTSATLLPIGESYPSYWTWAQVADESGVTDIAPGTILTLSRDGTAFAKGEGCGVAVGSYQVDASSQISFELDPSPLTCDDQAPVTQLVDLLGSADTWGFDNGRLVIELDDGGSLLFEPK